MFKKLSEKIALDIQVRLKEADFKNLIKTTQESSDRKFKVVASTGTVDRYNEIVAPEGMDKKNYMNNPVVLWAHSYRDLPIGIADKVYVKNKQIIIEGRFAPEGVNPEADKVWKLYEAGFLHAVSIGFIPKAWEDFKDDDGYKRKFTKWELLELSFVPVPANPEALNLLKAMGEKLGVDLNFAIKEKKQGNTEEAIKELAFVVKGIIEKINNIEKAHKEPSQEPAPKAEEKGKGEEVDGEGRKIVLKADFAQSLRKSIQVADKALEQINVTLKEALNNKPE